MEAVLTLRAFKDLLLHYHRIQQIFPFHFFFEILFGKYEKQHFGI